MTGELVKRLQRMFLILDRYGSDHTLAVVSLEDGASFSLGGFPFSQLRGDYASSEAFPSLS